MTRPTRRHILSGIAELSAGIAGASAILPPRQGARAATGETVIVIAAPAAHLLAYQRELL